MVTHEAAYLL